MTDYIFEGEIIKLNATDFYKWQDKFKNLNIIEELEELDMELEARQRDGKKVKNWFSECIPRLNGRNKRAQRFGGQNGQRKQSLAERAANDTRTILSNRAAREASHGYVGQDDTAIRPQVGVERGGENHGGWTSNRQLPFVVPKDKGAH
jgi:hypothetical protein